MPRATVQGSSLGVHDPDYVAAVEEHGIDNVPVPPIVGPDEVYVNEANTHDEGGETVVTDVDLADEDPDVAPKAEKPAAKKAAPKKQAAS